MFETFGMATAPHIWERKKLGIDLKQKYELYFASLVFTIAAASIQSAGGSGPRWRLVVEIASWCLLISSGIISLWRISQMSEREIRFADMQARADGIGSNELFQLGRLIRIFGYLQNGAFLLGLIGIAVSRAALLLNH
jgi:hypothetical protein